MEKKKIGVVIARFQTPALHKGHRYLLDYVNNRSEVLCVLLGSRIAVHTNKNPLSFDIRKEMILESYPNAQVFELLDSPSDKTWSTRVDRILNKHFGRNAILYGSRDSFIPFYCGQYKVIEIPKIDSPSGTDLRKKCTRETKHNEDFRKGIIHAAENRFPLVMAVVDCALYKKINGAYQILLGQKEGDEDKFRFVGGFVDKTDKSFEDAACRELKEETGGKIFHSNPEYVASGPVLDHRYCDTNDAVFTAFFALEYKSGKAIANDDIDKVKWFPLETISNLVIKSHIPFTEKLISFLKIKI